jgi:hypothetical protein
MIRKAINAIERADIDRLVEGAVEESNQLDFKEAPVGPTRDDKKEFVADVCAFANTSGGDLVFGIREDGAGAAHEVVPLPDRRKRHFEVHAYFPESDVGNRIALRHLGNRVSPHLLVKLLTLKVSVFPTHLYASGDSKNKSDGLRRGLSPA